MVEALEGVEALFSVLIPTRIIEKISYMVFRPDFLQDLHRNSTK